MITSQKVLGIIFDLHYIIRASCVTGLFFVIVTG